MWARWTCRWGTTRVRGQGGQDVLLGIGDTASGGGGEICRAAISVAPPQKSEMIVAPLGIRSPGGIERGGSDSKGGGGARRHPTWHHPGRDGDAGRLI